MKSFKTFRAELLATEAVSKQVSTPLIDVNKLVSAENDNISTQLFEAAAVIVAMQGTRLTKNKLDAVMKHSEFSKEAKTWITDFLTKHSNGLKALLDWLVLIGESILEVEKSYADFIHQNVKAYRDAAPSTFEVPEAGKVNTVDAVFIKTGTQSELIDTLKEIGKLPPEEQGSRLKATKSGRITLYDDKKSPVVVFYQVSLKKGAGPLARIGKIKTFFNKNYLGGKTARPSDAAKTKKGWMRWRKTKTEEIELDEGWLRDAFDKFKSLVSAGIGPFISWIKRKFTRLSTRLGSRASRIANRFTKQDKGFKAINNILVMGNLKEGYLAEKAGPVTLTSGMIEDFKFIKDEIIGRGDRLNKLHETNIKLVATLNKHAVKGRPQLPITFAPDADAGKINRRELLKQIGNILKKKEGSKVSREDLVPVLKIGMNYSGEVAIWSMLRSLEYSIADYDNLSEALYAFSASFETEAKFGNTALPLVIVYGGKGGKKKVLGKRIDFKGAKQSELLDTASGKKWGKKLNDFPVLVIKINKAGRTQWQYNVIKFYLVSYFEKVKEGKVEVPKPVWMIFEVQSDSGSSFTTKIEGSGMTNNWVGRG